MKRLLACIAVLLFASAALAEDAYPARAVRIIVPFPAGGVADALPRIVAEKLTARWGVPVIVENKAGAAGNIGMGCLLYTSPSPRDRSLSRMPSSA